MSKTDNSSRLTNMFGQPGVLEWGIFLTQSTTKTTGTHYLYLTLVPKTGPIVHPHQWSWNTTWFPAELRRELNGVLSGMLDGLLPEQGQLFDDPF
jgi:hypothetical protein